MAEKKDPCTICETYQLGIYCELDTCPVYQMKEENKQLKEKVSKLRDKISRMKADASWDEDIRRGQVQGMW